MAGFLAERQENGVIRKISETIRQNKKFPVTILSRNKTKLQNIIGARKYTGRQITGSEPYIDVIFEQMTPKWKTKEIGLSLKGESAPSLAGGGLRGINLAVPGLANKFMKAVFKKLNDMGLEPGAKVPDVYGEIRGANKKKIVVGNKEMGGPIDYMYIGPMNVAATFDTTKNTLLLNGDITGAEKYAQSHRLYFRLRARREDQRYDPDSFDIHNVPKIYGQSPSRGDSSGRIVVTDKVPNNAIVIKL